MGLHNVGGHAVTYPLDPTRWWPHAGVLNEKSDETGGRCGSCCSVFNDIRSSFVTAASITLSRCLGIQCNIWGRAQDSTQLVHRLRGGGTHLTGYRALMWQSLLTSGYEGVLGTYEPLLWLPRKAAIFLFEYHDKDFRAKVPGLPALPAPQDRDQYLDVHAMLEGPELRGLMRTWSIRSAMKDRGHFRLFGTLAIGHTEHLGFQRVQCWPFPDLKFYGANRQDHVIVRPPGAAAEGFTPSPDNVWYCKTLLLFDMEAETDSGPKQYRCAYISLLEQLKPRQPAAYTDLRGCGSRAIYEHDSNVRHEQACADVLVCKPCFYAYTVLICVNCINLRITRKSIIEFQMLSGCAGSAGVCHTGRVHPGKAVPGSSWGYWYYSV